MSTDKCSLCHGWHAKIQTVGHTAVAERLRVYGHPYAAAAAVLDRRMIVLVLLAAAACRRDHPPVEDTEETKDSM